MEDYISVPQLVIENWAVKFLLFMLNISVIKHFFSINGCFYFLSGHYFCSQKKKIGLNMFPTQRVSGRVKLRSDCL